MLLKLIALSVVFGLIVAEPISNQQVRVNRHVPIVDDIIYAVATKPDLSTLVLNTFTTLIGYKESALSLAVEVIDWLVSNTAIIIVGGLSTLALCKFTDKCGPITATSYEDFVPLTPFRELVTPERLESAEKFLASAVTKYAEEKRGRMKRNL